MKTISAKLLKSGKIRVVVDLDAGEQLVAVNPNAYYKLADPLNDIVSGDLIEGAERVTWCSIEQAWV